jgi:D-beta-D-heptose 7-phosphate kinase/D-beta-D-heptose 1-phosphate adenosyltransferase
MKVGIVSGYFNPVHKGHIEYIQAAKSRCDGLIVIVNNDKQVKIKGSKEFMDEEHRRFIAHNIKGVDLAVIAIDDDASVAKTLQDIATLNIDKHDLLFFNSGDRKPSTYNKAEEGVCKEYNIEKVFIELPKQFSSSELKNHS